MLTDSGNTVSGQIFYTTTHGLNTFVLFTHHWLGGYCCKYFTAKDTRNSTWCLYDMSLNLVYVNASMRISFERCPLSSTSS